ncbi:polysaccharide deacetylase family protein [Paenibacillus alkaliterrae]|uniref:polysaccharide deacetylase family protein n=1 Tax=Paenibacillus alkaliterrae TaxID=320909 RepID=UPI001F355A45|nr:polysaccharide deacetylase family protein [Paenibacillus alkaliterrae]MCF2939186.1 polysaccharide deacetylase family protein [Paenibacillus alkaliterrae]
MVKLPYSPDDRLLILNADDFGMCHSTNQAISHLLREGAISSASMMMTCPWTLEAALIASRNSYFEVGVHLTFTSEWENYKWGPVSRGNVDTLVNDFGHFPPGTLTVETKADFEQVKHEIIAQIEIARRLGIDPTNLDNHMGSLQGIFTGRHFMEIVMDVCAEYGLPYRFSKIPLPFFSSEEDGIIVELAERKGVRIVDEIVVLPFMLQEGENYSSVKQNTIQLLRGIKAGITEMVFHPSLDTDELKAITDTWQSRRYEFDLFQDEDIKAVIHEEKIKIIGWRELRDLQRKG